MRMQVVCAVGVVLVGLLAGRQAGGAVPNGCCQFKAPPLFAFFGLPPIVFCDTTTESRCFDSESEHVDQEFTPGKVCGSLGQCVDPGPRISTTNLIGRDAADCATGAAQPVATATAGEQLVDCHVVCNNTGGTLTNFSLFINGEAEFENLVVNTPAGECRGASRPFRAAGNPTTTGLQEIVATWKAADGTIPPDGTANSDVGGPAGPVVQVFTESQRAFVIVTRAFGAPAIGGWIAGLLGAGLLGLGVRRLRR